QGRFRLDSVWSILRRFCEYLLDTINEPRLCFTRSVSKRFVKNGYENTMKQLARRFDTKCHVISTAIRLGIADEYKQKGDINSARALAVEASAVITSSPILAEMCIEFGA